MAIKTIEGASRFYYDEEAPETKYPGVTSVCDMLPKKFIPRWYGNMAADLALDSFDFLQAMAARDREGAKKYIAGAAKRYTDARAKLGSQAHDLFERMVRGEGRLTDRDSLGRFVTRVHPDLVPYRKHFAEFLAVVKPQLVRAEDVAWSDTHRYAGSFDAWLRVRVVVQPDGTWALDPDGEDPASVWVDVIVDWKTSKSIWASVAIQMSAYANADLIISPDGVAQPMPVFDGAYVLHVTDKGWNFVPVYADALAIAFRHFLHLRETFEWENTISRKVIGKSSAGSKKLITGTQRRG